MKQSEHSARKKEPAGMCRCIPGADYTFRYAIIWVTLVPCLMSCDNLLFNDEPGSDPESVFETLWSDFDQIYPFFDLNSIAWDSVYTHYQPKIDPDTPDNELFDLLSEILEILEDGHVTMEGDNRTYSYDQWHRESPVNFDIETVVENYLVDPKISQNQRFLFAYLPGNLGYIYIPDLRGEGWVDEIDHILREFQSVDGIILDLRSNGGGNDSNSKKIAARFVDERVHFRSIIYRNGPGHSDFTSPRKEYISPDGEFFDGPVAILTNRRVFSAAESLVLAMKVIPDAVIVGDTTGGGSSNPLNRELPNGWIYQISTWVERDTDDVVHQGRGIYPDIPVWNHFTPSGNVDNILESAMKYLSESK